MNKIIINADDFGISECVNDAIIKSFKNGYINRTTVMVNMPGFEDACEKAKHNGLQNRVGLHLNLVEGKPLTKDIQLTSLCDENGYFSGNTLFGEKGYLLRNKEREAVAKEIDAQIKKFLEKGFSLKHLDSHRHTHCRPSVLPIVLSLAKENGFYSIRLSRNIPQNDITGLKLVYKKIINKAISHFNLLNDKDIEKVTFFGSANDVEKILDIEMCGIVELMMHPTLKGEEIVDAVLPINIDEWMLLNRKRFDIYEGFINY